MCLRNTRIKMEPHSAIVFFDSECLLCNQAIQIIAKHDKNDYFRFAGLQSKYAGELLNVALLPENLDSIILFEEGTYFYQWEAVWRIARKLRYWHTLSYVMRVIPNCFGNVLYGWVARNRKRWFGRNEKCDLGLRDKMLD